MVIGGLWPVVQRELRESARRPLNHWLRWSGAALAAGALLGFDSRGVLEDVGVATFTKLDAILTVLILFLLPVLTADCIARERRDGTLGLLFMTPLTASEIVIGKVVSRVLRVFAIWLGALPILAVCFICGGIEPIDILTFVMIQVACGLVALSAGLLATSLARSRVAAFTLAFVLLAIFLQPIKPILDSFDAFSATRGFAVSYSGTVVSYITLPATLGLQTGYSANHVVFSILAEKDLIALLMFWASIRIAGAMVKRSWQDKPPSKFSLDLIKRYCTPLRQFSFRQRMRKTLESNPISWLQQYSWKARTSKWSLCLLFVGIESFAIDGLDLERFATMLVSCLLLLFGLYTFAGINGFHYDKRSGALELILVTPLKVTSIIFGRVRGLWKLFLPSTAILVGSTFFVNYSLRGSWNAWYAPYGLAQMARDNYIFISIEIILVYLTLPIAATSMALRFKRPAVSAAATAGLAFGPSLLVYCHQYLKLARNPYYYGNRLDAEPSFLLFLTSPGTIVAAQLFVTWFAYNRLRSALEKRKFAFT